MTIRKSYTMTCDMTPMVRGCHIHVARGYSSQAARAVAQHLGWRRVRLARITGGITARLADVCPTCYTTLLAKEEEQERARETAECAEGKVAS